MLWCKLQKSCTELAVGKCHFEPVWTQRQFDFVQLWHEWCVTGCWFLILTSRSTEWLHLSLPAVQLCSLSFQLLLSPQQLSSSSWLLLHTYRHIQYMSTCLVKIQEWEEQQEEEHHSIMFPEALPTNQMHHHSCLDFSVTLCVPQLESPVPELPMGVFSVLKLSMKPAVALIYFLPLVHSHNLCCGCWPKLSDMSHSACLLRHMDTQSVWQTVFLAAWGRVVVGHTCVWDCE